MNSVGVIGAGASGMIAALEAAGNGAKVTILERKDKVGKKILATGNGRCNFTNSYLNADCYYTDNTDFINDVFRRFDNSDLVRYFCSLGLITKDKNGYYYPQCEQASSVVDVFYSALKEKQVEIVTGCEVVSVKKEGNLFIVESNDKQKYTFDVLIFSCGGKSGLPKNEIANGYDMLKSLGHSVSKLFPCLTQIKCMGINFKAVSGVRSDCELKIISDNKELMSQCGEVLFTDYGISGIVSFQISHLVNELLNKHKKAYVILDLLPGMSEEELKNFTVSKLLLHPELSLDDFFIGFVNKKVAYALLKSEGLNVNNPISSFSNDDLVKMSLLFKRIELECTGTNDFENSQVTGGGIGLNEITSDFESKIETGLYITGELLDVDGICGGYNLQWAFSSGYIAGNAASKSFGGTK